MSAQANWQLTKSLLIDRIRRRYIALQRFSNAAPDSDALNHEIESCGDDAKSFWALAERIDRALDFALAPRTTRAPVRDPALTHDQFKTH